jgi:glucose/mannose-6-phosphate isomerase
MITPDLIKSLDPDGMGTAIAGMGNHVLDAMARTEAALATLTLPKKEGISNIVLAGLGGSAIGGDLVKSYLASSMHIPMTINRTYRLPAFVDSKTLVIVSSYSGATEETLEMYENAQKRGAQIVCISTGGAVKEFAARDNHPFIELPKGFQPRAALAYSFVPVLMLLEKIGFTGMQKAFLTETASKLHHFAVEYGPDKTDDSNQALSLATLLQSKIPVVYSDCEWFDTVNIRWRGQIQENAKHVAFGNILPEMNHNEINGWSFPEGMQEKFAVVFLRSLGDEHPRLGKRFDILREVLQSKGVHVEEIHATGYSPLARMFSLIALGDWTSYYIALLCGVDPSPVPVISLLKSKLAS